MPLPDVVIILWVIFKHNLVNDILINPSKLHVKILFKNGHHSFQDANELTYFQHIDFTVLYLFIPNTYLLVNVSSSDLLLSLIASTCAR